MWLTKNKKFVIIFRWHGNAWPKKYEYPNPCETGFPNSIEFKGALAWYSNPLGALSQIIPSTTMSQRTRCHRRPYEILGNRQRKACNIIQVRGFNMWSCPCQGAMQYIFSNTTVNSNLKRQIIIHTMVPKMGQCFFLLSLFQGGSDYKPDQMQTKLNIAHKYQIISYSLFNLIIMLTE